MAWYDEAVFYHIYPLGLAGAPKENTYGEPVHRLNNIIPWISHIKEIGCNALYIGPLFESVGHGYETTDYKKLDSRLGDNNDLKNFVKECHKQGIKVIFDGVFNHTGRDFFVFQDIKKNRESSQYKDWYCNVYFGGNNEYNDGFSYENWGGYNLLAKINQRNPAVKDYICDVIRFWVSEFDVDGIRLDAADVLDFDYMKALRHTANEVKPDFWLMGEVIHGDYTRWVNGDTLHSVTNYNLHKALYSGHNDHNYFEIAHTVKRLYEMGGNKPDGLKLYNFVDNHDVERIYTKLNNKAHFVPVHVLMYTLPGVPSIYYGSEFGIEGRKERFSDDSLRPALNLEDYKDALNNNECTILIRKLGLARQASNALSYGAYKELMLTNRQYAFSRSTADETAVITVNNDDSDFTMTLPCGQTAEYIGAITGQKVSVQNGQICVNLAANSGEIWLPCTSELEKSLKAGNIVRVSDGNKTVKTEADLNKTKAEKAEKNELDSGKLKADKAVENEIASEKAENDKNVEIKARTGKNSSTNETSKNNTNTSETSVGDTAASSDKSFEEGKIAGLQEAILAIMERHGNVTEQMKRDVYNNTHHDSLITWVKSFFN